MISFDGQNWSNLGPIFAEENMDIHQTVYLISFSGRHYLTSTDDTNKIYLTQTLLKGEKIPPHIPTRDEP